MKKIVRLFTKGAKSIIAWILLLLLLIFAAITVAEYVKLPSFIPSWSRIFEALGLSPEAPQIIEADKFEIHIIDVGKADSILIRCEGEDMLIDAGEKETAGKVINYLSSVGVKRLKYVMASHPHNDHIGGMSKVLKRFDTDEIIMGDYPVELTPTSNNYEKLLDTIEDKNIPVKKGEAGVTFELGSAKAEILFPYEGYINDELNNYSLVTRFEYGERSFLMMGDCEEEAEDAMLDMNVLKPCDFLKVGHHGSNSSTKKRFLSAIKPEYAAISVGQYDIYGHPDDKVLGRLDDFNVKYYRTDYSGTIVIRSDGSTITVDTEK
ncbi:MAG: MBL fold metallo-hydrolase [Clostridia bacterium]|nr:MBL fold metallo-hydrolase [Clostridia bacterium]